MKTIIDIINLSSTYLTENNIGSPRREAEQLIADVLGLKRLDLYMKFDRPLNEKELSQCREALRRRISGEPSQYIRGEVEFYDCVLEVSTDVLIPRQETELLVDKIVTSLKKEDVKGKVLWDVCCGSGCIGIAIKNKMPELAVILSDKSPFAVEIAKKNALRNQVDVEILLGDLLQPFGSQKTDFLVSNPPYISENEYKNLELEVRKFEPREALIAGVTGLEVYQQFAEQLRNYLLPGGRAWFEIGAGQGESVKKIFKSKEYRNISVEKDWSNHDRFFFLEKE